MGYKIQVFIFGFPLYVHRTCELAKMIPGHPIADLVFFPPSGMGGKEILKMALKEGGMKFSNIKGGNSIRGGAES